MSGAPQEIIMDVEGVERQFEAMRQRRPQGLGLRWQVLAVLTVVVLVTILLIGLVVLHIGERNLVQQKAQSGVAVAEVLAQTIAAGLEPGEPLMSEANRAHLTRAAALNTAMSGISQVAVVDRDMRQIVAAPDIEAGGEELAPGVEHAVVMGERTPWWTIQRRDAGRELLVLTPLEDSRGILVGAVGLRMPMDEVDAQIAASQRLVLLYIIIDALVLLLVGYLLLTRLIVRPIEAIARATRRVAQGDYTSALDIRPTNEVGHLADDFNTMLRQLQTHRRKLEDQVERLRRANDELAQAHQSLIRSEKLATVGRLAAGVAHEIGNPLSAVLGYVELMRGGDLDPSISSDLLERVDGELHRIDKTVRELLDYSRTEGRDNTLCDLGQVIEGAMHLVEAQPRFRSITLTTEIAAGLPPVTLNEGRMQQVLVNLLLNAADAIEDEGLIEVRASRQGDRISLQVEDSGAGIDPQALPHLFEPFYTTKAAGSGTGLGLAICHSIVTGFGGDIEAGKGVSGGALFTIHLPASQVVTS